MRKPGLRIALIALAFALVFLVGWSSMYPSPGDPKNMKYVLWKAGLYKMDPDDVLATMIGDPDRDKLVLGRTKEQLRNQFGPLLSPADASPYLQNCYQNSSWKDRDALFVRQSPWVIIFEGGKAAGLVLIKGC
jgi:hypothetical protein